jgi:hypothetical protein
MHRHFRQLLPPLLGACALTFAGSARADIPADYAGKPYMGTPSVIPGRVDLVNVDTGGLNVAFFADHHRGNSAGYEPISGNDYRPGDKDLPNICKTNVANKDYWLDDNAPYPSAENQSEYYIGYSHAVDWVKITVDVKYAGKYNVSSNWASDEAMWGCSIWFNDGKSPVDPMRPRDGVNKSGIIEMAGTDDFHKWKAYPNFATVDLSAGLQVMTFHLEKHDHLQYGFLVFDLIGGEPGMGGAGGAGAAGMAGGMAEAGTGGGVAGAGAASGGVPSSSAGMPGAGTSPMSAAGATASGGSPASLGNTPSAEANDDGSCAVTRASNRFSASALLAVGLGALLFGRRRRATWSD